LLPLADSRAGRATCAATDRLDRPAGPRRRRRLDRARLRRDPPVAACRHGDRLECPRLRSDPVSFLVGVLRTRLRRALLGKLLLELAAASSPDGVRDVLARPIGEPTPD